MAAEQIPGTLYVLLVALAAWMIGDAVTVVILALGCAAGWAVSVPTGRNTSKFFFVVALALWALAFVVLLTRIFL